LLLLVLSIAYDVFDVVELEVSFDGHVFAKAFLNVSALHGVLFEAGRLFCLDVVELRLIERFHSLVGV
jgi:hypothetical protein